MTTMVRSGRPDDEDIEVLRARVTGLEPQIDERRAEVARVTASLDAFRIEYHGKVGMLHEELDDLERAIAEAEIGEISKRLADAGGAAHQPSSPPSGDTTPRFTSDAVRKLFRDVAKIIHPDLAGDGHARDRRHSLMIQANRAYALGDEEQLRSILDAWERSPEAVPGSSPEAERLRLARRVTELEDRLRATTDELKALEASPLWELKTMVDAASEKGRDLIHEMVRRLERDILAARNRLDAMRPPP